MKKTRKIFVAITLVSVLLFLSFIPFIHTLNYSGFNALAVSVNPDEQYFVPLHIPQFNNLPKNVAVKAENKVIKTLGMPSNKKSNPIKLYLEKTGSGRWIGYIFSGDTKYKFSQISLISDSKGGAYESYALRCIPDNNFVGKNAWINIFILKKASKTLYLSATVQNGLGNVLATLTYGRLPERSEFEKEFGYKNTETKNNFNGEFLPQATNGKMKLERTQVTYSTLNDPFGYLPSRTVITQRADAMANNPFPTNMGTNQNLSLRSWAFFNDIEQFYKDVYSRFGSYPWANAGVWKIVNSIKTNYRSNVSLDSSSPGETNSSYRKTPISVSFSIGFISISYNILLPYKGVKIHWTKSYTGDTYWFNKATVTARTRGPDFTDTYDQNWKNLLVWKGDTQNAGLFFVPPSDYKGFYSMMQFSSGAYGSYFTANYYSEYDYSVRCGNGSLWDIFYVTSKDPLLNVRLDN